MATVVATCNGVSFWATTVNRGKIGVIHGKAAKHQHVK